MLDDRHENGMIDGKYSDLVENMAMFLSFVKKWLGLFRLLVAGQ